MVVKFHEITVILVTKVFRLSGDDVSRTAFAISTRAVYHVVRLTDDADSI